MRFAWFGLAVVALATAAWMGRIETTATDNPASALVLDRWAGTVRLCSIQGCLGTAYPREDARGALN